MIIPVKCFTCGSLVSEKWTPFISEITERKNLSKEKVLKKLQAGLYEINYASKKALEKNKFKLEGILKSQILFNNKRYKSYWYGLIL